jgi:hypothetical protein
MQSAKRALPLFLAFSFIAGAQTITGLPQYGITLSGTSTQLQVINSGSHAIAGIVLGITFANGGPVAGWKSVLVPGMIPPDSVVHPLSIPMPGGDVTAFSIDGVVLDNGTYVGPDVSNSFGAMQRFVADAASVASLMAASDIDAGWAAITTVAGKTDASFPKRSTAKLLLGLRDGKGDTAAINAAQMYLKLAPLTKGN